MPGCRRARAWLVNHNFSHAQDVVPGKVRGAHGNALGSGGHVRGFVDVRRSGATQKGDNPGWCSLRAGYKTFGSELKSVREGRYQKGERNEGQGGRERTIPVDGSTAREMVSTATTWLEDLFHGQYFRQLAVETSSHE